METEFSHWNIWPFAGQSHAVVFELRSPIQEDKETVFTIRLDFLERNFKRAKLGRFRLSVASSPNCARDENLISLARGKSSLTRLATAYVVNHESSRALNIYKGAAGGFEMTAQDLVLRNLIHTDLGQTELADLDVDQLCTELQLTTSEWALVDLAVEAISMRIQRRMNP